jgi:soluble lytic murein transglycosylase-like protein
MKSQDLQSALLMLEARYAKTQNPAWVWYAIAQVALAGRLQEAPMGLPNWVLSYLFDAAIQITAQAIGFPDGNRHQCKAPTRNADGITTHYADHFWGLTAAQRREVLLEALGFKSSRGKNFLQDARRELDCSERVSKEQKLRQQGFSATAAATLLEDSRLRMSSDPARKLRRDRRKLIGGT